MIQRLCVVGVGLLGGSVARAARDRKLCRHLVGVDGNAENLRKALEYGVIDEGFEAETLRQAVQGSDWVVLATPVGAFGRLFESLRENWSENAIYTDVGSTKQSVIDDARKAFGEVPENFVPGHPIAGAENSGVEAARADLFHGKRVILTPGASTGEHPLKQVMAFWAACGAEVSIMDAARHDEVLAATSHLPHVLAFSLTHLLGRMDEQQEIFRYAAGGFRDFTRIASSDPKMWLDICLANRKQIKVLITRLGEELKEVAALLETRSEDELFEYFVEARNARQRFLNQLEK